MKRISPNITFAHYRAESEMYDSADFDIPFYPFDEVIRVIHHDGNRLYGIKGVGEGYTFLDFYPTGRLNTIQLTL